MENNQLAVYQNFDNISKAANALQKSGYFKDVTSEAQAIVKVMAGAELGLPPFASMAGIHIIQGKPALGSNVIATLVKNDPRYNYKVVECNNKVCTIAWFEDGQSVGESSFTMDEANIAGLTNNPSWKKFPSDMLFARAITRGARRFAPGIFGGSPIYTPEELGAEVDEDGYIDTTHRVMEENHLPTLEESISLVEEAEKLGGVVKASMSLEMAEGEKNRDGVRYGDLPNDKLAYMGNKLADIPNPTVDQQRKLDAIKVILEARNK